MIHGHLGGIVPYLVERLRASWKGYAKEWGLAAGRGAGRHLRDPGLAGHDLVLRAGHEVRATSGSGAEHLIVGTDYAHRVGDPEGAIKSIKNLGKALNLPQAEVDAMLGSERRGALQAPADARALGRVSLSPRELCGVFPAPQQPPRSRGSPGSEDVPTGSSGREVDPMPVDRSISALRTLRPERDAGIFWFRDDLHQPYPISPMGMTTIQKHHAWGYHVAAEQTQLPPSKGAHVKVLEGPRLSRVRPDRRSRRRSPSGP